MNEREIIHRRNAAFVRSPQFESTARRKRELDDIDAGVRDVGIPEYVGLAIEYFDGRDDITRIYGITGQSLTQLLNIEVDRQRGVDERLRLGMRGGLEHGKG